MNELRSVMFTQPINDNLVGMIVGVLSAVQSAMIPTTALFRGVPSPPPSSTAPSLQLSKEFRPCALVMPRFVYIRVTQ